MVFLEHVCADLFRVLAHACAWELILVSSMYRKKLGPWDRLVAVLWFS